MGIYTDLLTAFIISGAMVSDTFALANRTVLRLCFISIKGNYIQKSIHVFYSPQIKTQNKKHI